MLEYVGVTTQRVTKVIQTTGEYVIHVYPSNRNPYEFFVSPLEEFLVYHKLTYTGGNDDN